MFNLSIPTVSRYLKMAGMNFSQTYKDEKDSVMKQESESTEKEYEKEKEKNKSKGANLNKVMISNEMFLYVNNIGIRYQYQEDENYSKIERDTLK